MKAYRLVEVKNNRPLTLFHAVKSSLGKKREIPLGEWLCAEEKLVTDGSSTTKYLSGFNVLLSLEELKRYTKRFTKVRELRIVEVEVDTLRAKEHSHSPVFLASKMYLPPNWLENSVRVK